MRFGEKEVGCLKASFLNKVGFAKISVHFFQELRAFRLASSEAWVMEGWEAGRDSEVAGGDLDESGGDLEVSGCDSEGFGGELEGFGCDLEGFEVI